MRDFVRPLPERRCRVEPDAPQLAGIHHLKLPVTELARSREWYETRLGYRVQIEFVEQGQLFSQSWYAQGVSLGQGWADASALVPTPLMV